MAPTCKAPEEGKIVLGEFLFLGRGRSRSLCRHCSGDGDQREHVRFVGAVWTMYHRLLYSPEQRRIGRLLVDAAEISPRLAQFVVVVHLDMNKRFPCVFRALMLFRTIFFVD